MPPKTKTATDKFLIGQPDSALRQEFILAVQQSQDEENIHPWVGPLQLPTREQVLKLYLFYKEHVGLRNSFVSQSDISNKVASHVTKYWYMAGFQTVKMSNVVSHVKKEVMKFQDINKHRSRNSEKEIVKRNEYTTQLGKLFDIATPDLENILSKSRILAADDECTRYRLKKGYTRKTEDISFLEDQRGERKMVMTDRDTSYEERAESNRIRRQKDSQEPSSSQVNSNEKDATKWVVVLIIVRMR